METRAIVIKVAHKMGLLSHLSQLFRMLEVQGKVYTHTKSIFLFLSFFFMSKEEEEDEEE